MQVNQNVVTGFTPFETNASFIPFVPKYASPSCLSVAMQALWTNRIPKHEPWPRLIQTDGPVPPNAPDSTYVKNVRHIDQYDNVTSPEGLQPIGRVEGDETIPRTEFWRR